MATGRAVRWAMSKHNHPSDDRLIQYQGKSLGHIRGNALTNFVVRSA
jgi:hypothetical protein